MNNRNCDLILKQHQMIRVNIDVILGQLELLKNDPSKVDMEGLEKEIKQLVQLMEAHSIYEEEVLLPILKEMYESQPEILRYVVEDHEVLEKELAILIEDSALIPQKRKEIKALLNRINVHFVEEETGLLPLVQMYLLANPLPSEN